MLKDMLHRIAWTQKVEFNNLYSPVSFEETQWKESMYMLGGVSDTTKRNKDDDITKKCYMFADIDIRSIIHKRDWVVIDDDGLFAEIDKILDCLRDWWLDWFAYAVYSGNGLHLYYIGDEIEIDKTTYAKWVQYFYSVINSSLSWLWYSCDQACHNIARISRVPWSINPRKKESWWKVLWDLWPTECTILIEKEWNKQLFNDIKQYAVEYDKENAEIAQEVKTFTPSPSNDIWKDINKIDILPIVVETWSLTGSKDRWDMITLRDKRRNIGAYVYKPHNCVVTTWTTRAKTTRKTYTTYEFVLYEICDWDATRTRDYFKSKYGVEFDNKSKWDIKKSIENITIPEKKYFSSKSYLYASEIFDKEFEGLRSWELCIISSPTNMGKSTFAQKILERNKDEKSLYINLEFDLETAYEDARKKSRWFPVKIKGTDRMPYTDLERAEVRSYIETCKKRINAISLPQSTSLSTIIDIMLDWLEKWISLFVIDTFSSIEGADERAWQNNIARKLHEFVKKTYATVIGVHHYNKTWKQMAGSQKISDLANVVIGIEYKDWWEIQWSRFSLLKEKAVYWIKTIDCYFKDWIYHLYQ